MERFGHACRRNGQSISAAEVRRSLVIEEGMNGTAGLRRSAGIGAGAEVPVATLVVYKDDAGYGMKVSGDNPVFVVSVKAGDFPIISIHVQK